MSSPDPSHHVDLSTLPRGFRFSGICAGIKHETDREDISLLVSDSPATAAGVYTTNRVCAAPVVIDRALTPGEGFRAVAINSGNANACTGDRGLLDAKKMASTTATALGTSQHSVLVLSTGIIGEFLPMDRVISGLGQAHANLGDDAPSVVAAARGMMTTDTRPKMFTSQFMHAEKSHSLLGLAKGAAMIGPNMATMLGVVLTDVALNPDDAQRILEYVVTKTFNCISVDGHTSTNDTVLLLANGGDAEEPLHTTALSSFQDTLLQCCDSLARDIIDDGEGATHVIRIEVRGCANEQDAHEIAKAIADSPLVKTAVHGADPNWGRIVSAAGYSGIAFDPNKLVLHLNGFLLFQNGGPVSFNDEKVSASIRDTRETLIELDLQSGTDHIRFYSSDLTAEYVRLNADYHT